MTHRRLAATLAAIWLIATLSACGADGGNAASEGPSTSDAGSPAPPADARACSEPEGVIDRIVCQADAAVAADNLSVCDETDEDAVRYQCMAIFAERMGEPDACRGIPDTIDDGQELRDVCFADVAPVLMDAELCEEVVTPGLRDSCYLNVFNVTGDESLCAEMDDPGLKSLCTGEPVIIDP
ncbi:MAG: hypothetical protein ACRDGD_12540 [Candidatus Limnocylindria bacterium]